MGARLIIAAALTLAAASARAGEAPLRLAFAEAISLALAQNQGLRAARVDEEVAETRIGQARSPSCRGSTPPCSKEGVP